MKAIVVLLLAMLMTVPGASATDFGLDCMFGTEQEWESHRVELGDQLAAFETTFGSPDKDVVGPEWVLDGCGSIIVSHTDDGVVTNVSVFPPEGEKFTIGQTQLIAQLFLPEDSESVGNGFVDGYGFVFVGSSSTLLSKVPASAYDYVDNTPQYGQFTAAYWVDATDQEGGKFDAVFLDIAVDETLQMAP